MSLSRCLPLIVLAIISTSAAVPAVAQQGRGPRSERAPPSEPARSEHDNSVSDAVRRIERSNRGQVLSAERMQYDGRDVTRIKVVDNAGRVRIYMDDAKSNPNPNPNPQQQPPRNDDTPPRRRDDD